MALAFDANLGNVTNSATLTTSAAAASGSRVFVFVWWYDATGTCTGAIGRRSDLGGGRPVREHAGRRPATRRSSPQTLLPGWRPRRSSLPRSRPAPDFGPGIAAASFTGVATGASGYVDVIATVTRRTSTRRGRPSNLVTTNADDLLIASRSGSMERRTRPLRLQPRFTTGRQKDRPLRSRVPDRVLDLDLHAGGNVVYGGHDAVQHRGCVQGRLGCRSRSIPLRPTPAGALWR